MVPWIFTFSHHVIYTWFQFLNWYFYECILKKKIPQTHSAYGKVSYHMILYCIISLSTILYIMIFFFLYRMLFSSPKQWKPFWNCILIWGNDIAHWSLLHLVFHILSFSRKLPEDVLYVNAHFSSNQPFAWTHKKSIVSMLLALSLK